jgi:4-hydroxy-2-oxoheptanedioate aldolase
MTAEAEVNRLKRKLAAGELAIVSGNHESSETIDFAGSLGIFDAAWIDMEHGPVTVAALPDMSRAADLWGLASIVRVRAADPALIGLTLSQGVTGVVVPHVSTRAEAELVVDAARFPPLGHRGASGGRRSYGRTPAEQQEFANRETVVGVMIEDATAIANLPAILEVEGIDLFFVSHYDLAQSLGLGADVHHPRLVEAYDTAVQRIVAAGRVAAAVVAERDLAKYLAMGVRCLKAPNWQALAAAGARVYVERAKT